MLLRFAPAFVIGVLTSVFYFGSAADQPNVIIIMADDFGYGDLPVYRQGAPRTPAISQLAAEGITFTDAHSTSSVCTPTRYSLLTGRYNWRSYLQDWVLSERMPLLIEEGVETLPAIMKRVGYATGCIGKWHLGFGREMDAYQNNDFSVGPNAVGFDSFFGVPFSHNSSPEMEVFMENDRIVGLPVGRTIWEPLGLTAARRSLDNTAGDLSSAAIHFIEENRERPFFLYYATTNVHFPITPHAAFRMRGRGDDFESLYDGFVSEFDWAVDQVMRSLERLGLEENTLLVVTSDNGGALSFGANNDPWSGNKGEVFEGGHRVPFLARWPEKITAGTKCDEPVVTHDLFATCAEIVGHELDGFAAADGKSILPLFTGTDSSEFKRGPIVHHSVGGVFAIRDGDWKLIEGPGSGSSGFAIGLKDKEAVVVSREGGGYERFSFRPRPAKVPEDAPAVQLYNLRDDPKEETNVFAENPAVVERLRSQLAAIQNLEP